MSRNQPFRALLEEAFSAQGQALPRTLVDLPPMSARLTADLASAVEAELTEPLPVLLPSLPSMPSFPALRGPPPATTRARSSSGRRRRGVMPAVDLAALPVVIAEREPAELEPQPRRRAKAARPSAPITASPMPPTVQRAPKRVVPDDSLPPRAESLVLMIDVVEPRAYSDQPRTPPKPGAAQRKAHELYLAALDDMADGNVASALIHLKLAAAYDAKNGVVQDLVKQLEKKAAQKQPARRTSAEAEHGPREELYWVRSRR